MYAWTQTIFTGASGSSNSDVIYANDQIAPDTDGDGLSDLAEAAIGTDPTKFSTAGDGVSDGAKVSEGLNPLSGTEVFPTGIVSSLPLQGQAQSVTLVGSSMNPQMQTAYLATGSYGLAIVDASNFQMPTVLSQLALSGDSTDVSVDSNLQIAAVASNSGGLNFVDVSNPTQPNLLNTVNVNTDVVQVLDGVAYAAVGGEVQSYDMLTGELLQTLSIGSNNITGLALDGSFLYAIDAGDTLSVIDLSSPLMVLRGSVTLPDGGGKLFVSGGVAYAVATKNYQGGYETSDVSNPDAPTLIAASQVPASSSLPASAITPNGSGLGVLVGVPQRSSTGPVVDLMDLSDPTNTGAYLTQFSLPAAPDDVAIASGIAFVADGSGGLQVVNYEPFDTKGVPPTASISLAPSPNVAVTTSGIQVVEGSNVAIEANVADDVQVRNVELLVNGQEVSNEVSPPFNLSTTLPTIAAVGTTPVTIQVSATDTGGNTSVSNTLSLQLLPDTSPPVLLSNSIVSGIAVRVLTFQSVTLEFSKPLDTTTVTADNFQLIGPDGGVTPTNIQLRRNNAAVVITYPTLSVGSYQFIIHAASVTDVAGTPLGATDQVSTFSVVTATAIWNNPAGGYWDVASNWLDDKVPGSSDDVLVALPPGATVIYRGNQPTVKSLTNEGTIWIQGDSAEGNAQLTLSGLLTNTGTIELESANGNYSSQLSTPGGQIFNGLYGTIVVNNGSGGYHSIGGTLINQGQVVVASNTALDVEGVYQAQGGTIVGPGYLVNCTLEETAAPASASTILVSGTTTTLATDNLAGYTLWVQGSPHYGDTVLHLGGSLANRGTILLESVVNGDRSDIATGSYTLTNLGTITSGAGAGGERLITGTLNNQATIDATGDYVNIEGTYQAQGGTILGDGYVVNCTLQEISAPASASTILVSGTTTTLASDNLAGYTLWVQGSPHYGDTILHLGGNVSNLGTILLESIVNGDRSDVATGSYTLTNLGTITSGAGAGGERLITGTLNNQATIDATGDYVDIEGTYQAQGGTILGDGYVVNCTLQEISAPASASTILISGTTTTLATDNLAGYTLWVQGSPHYGDTVLHLGANVSNLGTILLESVVNGDRSDVATGSYTLTNLGTITSGAGAGGERLITGTLNNQATIDATADYADLEGVYQAQGGTILGDGYVVNCTLQEISAPASASTILISGTTTTLATDNLAGYTLWVQGSPHYGDTVLHLGANVSNLGTILLESVVNGDRSDVATGSYTLTNLGTITSGAGAGGERLITGTLVNSGIVQFSGTSPVALSVNGTYTQTSSGTLSVRLAGSGSGQYDQLLVTGMATLDGTLAVSLLNGFVPKPGDAFKLLTYGSGTGSFAQVNAPTGVALRVIYNATDADLEA